MIKSISKSGLDLVKEFEGFRENAYQCSAGRWTIGYGTTEGIKEGDKITEQQASIRLKNRLMRAEYFVEGRVKVPLTQNQFDALCSFVYNVGEGTFLRSTLLKYLNQGRYDVVPEQLKRFVNVTKGGKKVRSEGLVKRREKEAELFLKP